MMQSRRFGDLKCVHRGQCELSMISAIRFRFRCVQSKTDNLIIVASSSSRTLENAWNVCINHQTIVGSDCCNRAEQFGSSRVFNQPDGIRGRLQSHVNIYTSSRQIPTPVKLFSPHLLFDLDKSTLVLAHQAASSRTLKWNPNYQTSPSSTAQSTDQPPSEAVRIGGHFAAHYGQELFSSILFVPTQ